jgi:hypothetical protein
VATLPRSLLKFRFTKDPFQNGSGARPLVRLLQLSTCPGGFAITRIREGYSSSIVAGPSRADSAVVAARLSARAAASSGLR